MKTIFFPTQLGRDTLHDFFLDLELSKNEPEICVDCSTLNFSYPSGMLVAGSKMRAALLRNSESTKNRSQNTE